MRKAIGCTLLALALALPFFTKSWAGVSCSVPFNLTNGTSADASQVMANYNAILSCLANSTAASGANADITSLSALSTPLSPTQGGSIVFNGGVASVVNSGTTSAVTVSATIPTAFTLTPGYKVVFLAGAGNAGPTTMAVAGTSTVNFYRPTPGGPAPMIGGEFISAQMVEAVYDGTEFQMTSAPALPHAPGEVFDFAGGACPGGSFEAAGGQLAEATFPTLFGILGSTWGVPVGGDFILPDLRGRSTFARDLGGSGRITVAGGNFDGTVVGHTGGQQSNVVAQVNLASFALNVNDPGHGHQLNYRNTTATGAPSYVSQNDANGIGLMSGAANATTSASPTPAAPATTGITVGTGGSGTPLPTLSNAAIVLKCVKG